MRASVVFLCMFLSSCSRQGGNGGDSLQDLDLFELRLTPWGAMHLQMLYAPSDVVRYGNSEMAVEALAAQELEGFKSVWAAGEGEPRSSTYYFEREDHVGQRWAYRALGAMERGEVLAAADIASMEEAFLSCANIALEKGEEASWVIMLGCSLIQGGYSHMPDLGSKIEELVTGVLEEDMGARVHACGNTHEMVALSLASMVLSGGLRDRVKERIRGFRAGLELLRQPDGYYPLAGLHFSFADVEDKDRVRVLGHVAEFLSWQDGPWTDSESQVFSQLETLVSSPPTSNRSVGDYAHALAALRRRAFRGPS